MAKEEKFLEADVLDVITTPITLFTDYQKFNMFTSISDGEGEQTFDTILYKPARLHATNGDLDMLGKSPWTRADSYYPNNPVLGFGPDVTHANQIVHYDTVQSGDPFRANIGALWFTLSDGTAVFQKDNLGPAGMSFSIDVNYGVGPSTLNFTSPFIHIDTSKEFANKLHEWPSVSSIMANIIANNNMVIYKNHEFVPSPSNGPEAPYISVEEEFVVMVCLPPAPSGLVKDPDKNRADYLLNRLFGLASDIDLHSEKFTTSRGDVRKSTGDSAFHDYVTEINIIPKENTTNADKPVASITNSMEVNPHSPDLNDALKELTNEPEVMIFPNYAASLLYGSLTADAADNELSEYYKYLEKILTLLLGGSKLTKYPAGLKVHMIKNLKQGNISEYLKLYHDLLKNLTGASDVYGGGPDAYNMHRDKSKNVVIMQSMLKKLQQAYNNTNFPFMSKATMTLPFADEKVLGGDGEPFRTRSLIETLDRWDIDYALLKGIVENTQPGASGITALGSSDASKVYISNLDDGRPLFSPMDKIVTCPSIGYTDTDNEKVHYYRDINSFLFFSTTPPDDSGVTRDMSWLIMQGAAAEPGGNTGGKFISVSPNIYSDDINHIYLDVPGDESSALPFIKRAVAEESAYPHLENFAMDPEGDLVNATDAGSLLELLDIREDSYGKTRNYSDIVNGEKAKSEIIYFRIEKKDKNGNFLQNFFIPNSPEFNPKHFIDTQVVEGKDYVYTVFAWHAIYGTRSGYTIASDARSPTAGAADTSLASMLRAFRESVDPTPIKTSEGEIVSFMISGDYNYKKFVDYTGHEFPGRTSVSSEGDLRIHKFHIRTMSEPAVKVVEVPYYSLGSVLKGTSTKLVSLPPGPPVVEIVPYENKNNTLLFMLSATTGVSGKNFIIPINTEEHELMYDIYEKMISDGISDGTGDLQIEFETRSVERFEIYRIETKPRSYSDFSSGKMINSKGGIGLKPTSISFIDDTGVKVSSTATSVAFKDASIVPNKKYYYTFRVIDKDGYFSNPTHVYQIEIVDDGGTIYPLIDVVDFDVEDDLQATKPVRKYMHIIPTIEQSLINLEPIGADSPPDFANETAGQYLNKLGTKKPNLGIKDLNWKVFSSGWQHPASGREEYFKARLTSKKTGKKFDVNLRFKVNHNKTEEQIDSESV